MLRRFSLLVAYLILILHGNPSSEAETCPKAYERCNLGKKGFINVHLIAHTHNDVGWVYTVDQYYTGIGGFGQQASVRHIIGAQFFL
jgi:lysosomal alpha-mannosidase